nr:hypothetical protein [Tanacetum cinerariifolium]
MAPKKAAPKRTTRLNLTRDANQTGDDSHTSGTGVRRTELDGDGFSHKQLLGGELDQIELKKKMADKYCPRNEMKKIETEFWNLEVQGTNVTRYIGGLPDTIHGSVVASKPKTMKEATEMATGLMDKKIRTYAKRQPPKRQDVARAYAARSGNRQQSLTNANVANNQRGNGAGQKVTCYECGAQGHFKRYCPKLKNNNNNRGNQVGTRNAQARVYAVGNAGTNPDANTFTGTFLLYNCYAFVLFDTSSDRSFVSTAFSSQFDIAPTVLDHDYAVELADGRIVGVNTVIPWIGYADKIVLIPWGRETLIFHGNGSNQEHETRSNIISCVKTQKYMLKGCQVILAHVTMKEAEGKSEKKRLENVPIVRDFPKVFLEDLSGLPSTRQVVFQINLIPGAASVARAPYRLAPPEMKELSEQLKELSDKGFIRPSSSP